MGSLYQWLIVVISCVIYADCQLEEYFRWRQISYASVERGIIIDDFFRSTIFLISFLVSFPSIECSMALIQIHNICYLYDKVSKTGCLLLYNLRSVLFLYCSKFSSFFSNVENVLYLKYCPSFIIKFF